MPLSTGNVLNNRYQIVDLLGQGGFGAVYRAWDSRLNHACAIKENIGPTETERQFEREAKLLANLSHPNLPRVTDHFIVSGQGQYLVMDLVEGQDLQEILETQQKPVPESQAISWIVPVADALEYLHGQNPPIVHRDIKPANIILSKSGTISLVDFGLSKIHDPQLKTTLGAFGVSPGYSPQEQYGRGKTDIRSDVYALGATLYCLLTGNEPPESIQRNLGTALTPPRVYNSTISPQVEQAVLKAMEMQPAKRYQGVAAFRSAITGASNAPVRIPQSHPSGYQARSRSQVTSDLQRIRMPRILWLGLLLSISIILIFFGITYLNQNTRQNGAQMAASDAALVGTDTSWNATGIIPTATVQTTGSILAILPNETSRLPKVYTVAQDDTCSELAIRFEVSMEDIWRINNLPGNCDRLFAGQKLLIPTSLDQGLDVLKPIESETIPAGTVQTDSIDGMQLIYVPAGVFWRGSDNTDPQGRPDENPRQAIYLDAFWIDQTEVTNSMYSSCVREGACELPSSTSSKRNLFYFGQPAFDNYPVIYVSWYDADRYCRWAGRRLPSEAEWEKAARGVDGQIFPWGNESANSLLANYDNQIGDTVRVGNYPRGESPYGVVDMAGNVAEWIADWYDPRFYLITQVINPLGPAQGEFRVHRGGSWLSQSHAIRSAYRLWNYPDASSEGIGFRCMLSILGG